jgi:hypothetical protein
MGMTSIVPDLAMGCAERINAAFDANNVEDWTPDDVSAAIFACNSLQTLVALARRSIDSALRKGVDAKAFAAKYEGVVGHLGAVAKTVDRLAAAIPLSQRPILTEELVRSYRNVGNELTILREFLTDALSKTKTPRPIDWKRIEAAEAAYARGETKPLQRPLASRAGS